MILSKRRTTVCVVLIVLLVLGVSGVFAYNLLCFGNPPLCRSEAERFFIEPDILEAVRPRLPDWATQAPIETEAERERLGQQFEIVIDVAEWSTCEGGHVRAVYIEAEHYYEWTRGLLYVDEDVELCGNQMLELRLIEEHLYVFNSNY